MSLPTAVAAVPPGHPLGRWPSGSTSGVIYTSLQLIIIFFTYFYAAVVLNPNDLAENIAVRGFVPGIRPGRRRQAHRPRLSRITLPGAVFPIVATCRTRSYGGSGCRFSISAERAC
jgi:preprotein translocase subunit SecY